MKDDQAESNDQQIKTENIKEMLKKDADDW